jgi:hypothetical protein
MAPFLQNLKALFGWSGSKRPSEVVKRGRVDATTSIQPLSPGDRYHDEMGFDQQKRQDRYDVYDAMDNMSDVSTVLDAYSEDCTQLDQQRKKSVWIEAKNSALQKAGNKLLHDILNIEDWIEGVSRDTGKYGDDFCLLYTEMGKGVTSVLWRDPRDIERIENKEGILIGYEETARLGKYRQAVAASINAGGDGSDVKPTHEPWDVLHFRIHRRKRLPRQKWPNIYGTSLLAGSERIAKQMKILDDLLMIMRITRSLDRKTYFVDVGRSPVEEEVRILKRWRRALKRKTYVDPATGRFDSRFDPYAWTEDQFWPVKENSNSRVETTDGITNINEVADIDYFRDKFYGSLRAPKAFFGFEGDLNCFAGETEVLLLDGRKVPIEQLVGQEAWIYSCTSDGRVVPGLASFRLSGHTDELTEVELDNGETIKSTGDHRYVRRDGTFVFAKHLRENDSLMPIYRQLTEKGYEQCYVPAEDRYQNTHQLVAYEFFGKDLYKNRIKQDQRNIIHHDDFDKRNNSPNNLLVMAQDDHEALHANHGFPWYDSKFRQKMKQVASANMKKLNADPVIREKQRTSLRKVMQTDEYIVKCGLTKFNNEATEEQKVERNGKIGETISRRWELGFGRKNLYKMNEAGQRANQEKSRVANAEFFDTLSECGGSLTKYAEVIDTTTDRAIRRAKNRGLHYWTDKITKEVFCEEFVPRNAIRTASLPSRAPGNNHKVVAVRNISLDELVPVYDVSVIGEAETFGLAAGVFVHNSKATLSSQSLKWARAVNSLQRAVRTGLKRLCQIHFAYLGLPTDEKQFEVMMVQPSIIELLDKLEAWNQVVDVATAMSGLGDELQLNKRDWGIYILKNVLWLSDQEVGKFIRGIAREENGDQDQVPPQPPPKPKRPGDPVAGQPEPQGAPEEPKAQPATSPSAAKEGAGNGAGSINLAEIDDAIKRVMVQQQPTSGARPGELPPAHVESN